MKESKMKTKRRSSMSPSLFEDKNRSIEGAMYPVPIEIAKSSHIKKGEGERLPTKTSMKVSDLIFYMLNKRVREAGVDYFRIRQDVYREMQEEFMEHGLCDDAGVALSVENGKKMKLATNDKVTNKILAMGLNMMEVNLEEFIKELNIASFHRNGKIRFAQAIEGILEAQKAVRMEWITKKITRDYEIRSTVVSSMLIPTITLTLSPEFESLEKLMESKAQDKIKYIEKITFTFSPELFTGMLSYGGGFIQPDKTVRNRFTSVYSWRFELFIRSTIIGSKKWNNMLRFPIFGEDRLNLQKILGVNYKTYGKFKEKVLDVVVEDINTYTSDLKISYTPVKEGRKVIGVVFDVESPLTGEIDNRNFTLDYYIAVQHFFYSGKVSGFATFEEYHEWLREEGLKSAFKGKIAEWDRTVQEWEDEFNEELPAYEKLVRLWVSKEEIIEEKKPDITICPIKLCLTMKNGDEFYAFDLAKITKPSQSLKYLEEIL